MPWTVGHRHCLIGTPTPQWRQAGNLWDWEIPPERNLYEGKGDAGSLAMALEEAGARRAEYRNKIKLELDTCG